MAAEKPNPSGTQPATTRLPHARAYSAIWSIGAGVAFGVVRFAVDPIHFFSEASDEVTPMPWIGAICAGLSGALLWYTLAGRRPFGGFIAALLAALLSYVGIGLFVQDPIGQDRPLIRDPVLWLPITASTAWAVFPALTIVAVFLNWLQQAWGRRPGPHP
jgi:hypothetical protein